MGLTIHGPRRVSQLEKDAIRLVFGDSDSFSDAKLRDTVRIQVVNEVIVGGENSRGRQENGKIFISKKMNPEADDLDHSNTRANTNIFTPGNLQYLNTLIHEAAHWWERDNNKFTTRIGVYGFDYDELRDLDFRCKEQHASAAGTWFVIGWQLEYGSGNVNLTSRPRYLPEVVGTVDRYEEIDNIPQTGGSTSPPAGRWVT